MNFRKPALAAVIITLVGLSAQAQPQFQPQQEPLIRLQSMDPAFDALVSKDAKAEVLADGFMWCEGPVWIEKHKMLVFSDVRKNIIYKWTQEKGKEVYLEPSGYTGSIPRGGEMGSNGLGLSPAGELVICQNGNRQMAVMDAPLDKPQPKYKVLANNYNGLKFDSPNDVTFLDNGDIYFTDPPYGLERNVGDPLKEAKYQGVYRIAKKDGKVTLLTTEIARPNGIGIFPGGKQILIANSDPANPVWYIYDLDKDGLLANGRVFYKAAGQGFGSPDGLKIDKEGNVFATGPGGVWIFNKTGKLLGRIMIDLLTSNCSFSADQKTLYVTNTNRVLKIRLR